MLVLYLIGAALERVNVIGPIVLHLCGGATAVGIYGFYLQVARGRRPQIAVLLDGFHDFVRSLILYFLIMIFTLLWTLLFIVPGIIAALRYSQSYFILKDNPDITALEALRRSKAMMQGNKWRLFVLFLTFIGWFLLSIVTLGIGMLWVYPYVTTTIAHFYDDLRHRGAEQPSYASPPPHPGSF